MEDLNNVKYRFKWYDNEGGDYSRITTTNYYYTRLDEDNNNYITNTLYSRDLQIITYYNYLDISGKIKLGGDIGSKGILIEENLVPINFDSWGSAYKHNETILLGNYNLIGYSLTEGKNYDNRFDDSEYNIHSSYLNPSIRYKYFSNTGTVYYYLNIPLADCQVDEYINKNLVYFHVQVPRYYKDIK